MAPRNWDPKYTNESWGLAQPSVDLPVAAVATTSSSLPSEESFVPPPCKIRDKICQRAFLQLNLNLGQTADTNSAPAQSLNEHGTESLMIPEHGTESLMIPEQSSVSSDNDEQKVSHQGATEEDTSLKNEVSRPTTKVRDRPETSDVVARRMIASALGIKIPTKEDEKTAAISKAMSLAGAKEDRVKDWKKFKRI